VVGEAPEVSKEFAATVIRVEFGVLQIRANVEPHKNSTECGLEKEQQFSVDYGEPRHFKTTPICVLSYTICCLLQFCAAVLHSEMLRSDQLQRITARCYVRTNCSADLLPQAQA
jgi:hypothetical protein